MNIPIFLGLITFLGSAYIWIGKCASKNQETSEEYFLMGRKLSFFPLFLTLLATQVGGGTLMGAAQEAYTKGWLVLFYPLGASLGLFILGMGFGGKLRRLNISTIAEIFEKIFQSRKQRYIASGLSILALFFILVGQGIAARLFFVAMGINQPLVFVLFWTVLVAYTVMGGLKAVVNTDILQVLFILFTLGLSLFFIDFAKIPLANLTETSSIDFKQVPWSTWLFMPLLFMLIEQDMGQRCFAAKNTRAITFSSLFAGLFLLFCSSIAIYFGILAKRLEIPLVENGSILIESVKVLTNPVVSTMFMVAIFMAIISTADSLLCSISSNISCDFLSFCHISERKRVKCNRVITLITGLCALLAAYSFNNVVSMLMLSYELSVCILIIPISAAIFFTHPSKWGGYLSMALGALGFVLFRFYPLAFPKEMLTIFVSFCGYVLGALLRKERKTSKIVKTVN